jgi:predicted amidophosphoribosyltransferase
MLVRDQRGGEVLAPATAGVVCGGCGASVPPGKFCSSCGAELKKTEGAAAEASPAFCTQCGSPMGPDAAFCGQCGNKR